MHPILFQFGSIEVPSYGVLVTLGFLAGLWLTARQARRSGLDAGKVSDLALACGLAGIIGGKLAMFLFDFSYYAADPSRIFTVETLQAGGVFQGGLILAVLTAWWYMRRAKLPAWETMDAFAPGIALGHGIGRVGCFMAGCCYGDSCSRPWAVTFHNSLANETSGVPLGVPLHPTQLYESVAEFAICLILLYLARRPHPRGRLIGGYLVMYSAVRFVVEFLRHHDQALPFGGPFSLTQYLAIGLLILGAWLVLRRSPEVNASAAQVLTSR